MAQSDYLQHKKLSNQLKYQAEYPPVFDSQDLLLFKKYTLENSIQNTKLTYSQLALANYQKVFDIEKKVSSCPSLTMCRGTQTRPNRKLLPYRSPTPHPIAPLYIKKINPAALNIYNTPYCKCTYGKNSIGREPSLKKKLNLSFSTIYTTTTKMGQ
jgi:hypothetical protein